MKTTVTFYKIYKTFQKYSEAVSAVQVVGFVENEDVARAIVADDYTCSYQKVTREIEVKNPISFTSSERK